jgi:curved DNA-binding protein CbpA
VNYYEILELSRTASQDEVKAAYKKMASVVHPDKGGSAMLFRLVQEAYEVLSNPVKRRQHDSNLSGPSHGNHQTRSQNYQQEQQHSNTSQSEPNHITVEYSYKQWKEKQNRGQMPRSESIAAGGVRRMIRESLLIGEILEQKQFTGWLFVHCGNCGKHAATLRPLQMNPLLLVDVDTKEQFTESNSPICNSCSQYAGTLRMVNCEWNKSQFKREEVSIDVGDLLYFTKGGIAGSHQKVFGYVVSGSARSEIQLPSINVLDEFSGQMISPKNIRSFVHGHWKSNDLSKNRTGSMRNWSH